MIAFEFHVDLRARAHHSRRNGSDINLVATEFGADRIGKASEREFARGVRRHVRHRDFSTDRRDVDDASGALLSHLRNDLQGQDERRPQMQTHGAIKILDLHVIERTDLDNPGVIYQDVDLAEAVDALLDGRVYLSGIEQITWKR